MTWVHTRSVENDFGGQRPVEADLHTLVVTAAVWSQTFTGIRMVDGLDTVGVCFEAELTAGEITTLNDAIALYVYIEPTLEPLNNFIGTRDPDENDDDTDGWSAGSQWFNHANKKHWECVDPATGAADWKVVNVRYQSVVVDAAGAGDYTTIGAATTAGHQSIFIKNGLYVETVDIVLSSHGAQVIGETMGGVTIVLVAGNTIRADASGGNEYTVGTISCIHDTNVVTGTGTAWLANVSAGHMIMISENYYGVASVDSDTQITLADTYNGNSVTDYTYIVQNMYLGVRITNLIIANSSATGLFCRGLRNSTIYGVAIKGCAPNFHVQQCGNVGIINGASEKSTGDGICVDECVSVRVDTMGLSNCTGSGIAVVNASSAVVIGGSSSNSNKLHGIHVASNSKFVNVNDTVIRNNKLKGLYGEASTGSIVVVNCDTCENGTDGIDILGPNNSISDSPIMNNGAFGINVGDLSIISDNHVNGNASDGLNLVTSSNCVVVSNTIDNNGGDGIDILGDSNVIGMNRIQNNMGWGIKVVSGSHNTLAFNYNCTSNTAGNVSDGGTRTRFSTAITHHTTDPTVNDDVSVKIMCGDGWMNDATGHMWFCYDETEGAAQWTGGVAAPTTSLSASTTNAAGTSHQYSASDHSHAIDFGAGKVGGLLFAGGASTGDNFELRANAADTTSGFVISHAPLIAQTTPPATKVSGVEVTLTAAEALAGIVLVDPTAAHDLKMPTAASLVAAVGAGVSVGDTVRLSVVHKTTSAYAVTVTANTGVTFDFGSATVSNATSPMAATFALRFTNVTASSESIDLYRVA